MPKIHAQRVGNKIFTMLPVFLLSGAMGWCGTPFPGWWWYIIIHRHWPHPPEPDPVYRAFSNPMPGILGIIGGMAAGSLVHVVYPNESLVLVALAGLAGGRILSDLGTAFVKSK